MILKGVHTYTDARRRKKFINDSLMRKVKSRCASKSTEHTKIRDLYTDSRILSAAVQVFQRRQVALRKPVLSGTTAGGSLVVMTP